MINIISSVGLDEELQWTTIFNFTTDSQLDFVLDFDWATVTHEHGVVYTVAVLVALGCILGLLSWKMSLFFCL